MVSAFRYRLDMVECRTEPGKLLAAAVAQITVALENLQTVLCDVVEIAVSLFVDGSRWWLGELGGLDKVNAPRNLFGEADEVGSAFACRVTVLADDFLLFEAAQGVLNGTVRELVCLAAAGRNEALAKTTDADADALSAMCHYGVAEKMPVDSRLVGKQAGLEIIDNLGNEFRKL